MVTEPLPVYIPAMASNDTLGRVLARNLRRIREELLRLTQEQWEEKTKIAQSTLSAWERGDNFSQLDRIDAALRHAGVNPLEAFRSQPVGLTEEQADVLAAWEECDDQDVKRAVLGLLKSKARKWRSAHGIE
jgi:transcriptional regulator with XRE-family HTH domain